MIENAGPHGVSFFMAPANLSSDALAIHFLIAEQAVYLAPAMLVWLWIIGEEDDRRAAAGACLAALIGLAIAAATSALWYSPRPFADGLTSNFLRHAADSGFPSDHATLLFSIGYALLFSPPVLWRPLWVLPLGLAFAVSLSRVYLGAHYPIDIAGASILGAACAALLASGPGRRIRNAITSFGIRLYSLPSHARKS